MLAGFLSMGPFVFPLGILAAMTALVAAIVIGVPILWVALRAGMRREISTVALGVVTGALSPALYSAFWAIRYWRYVPGDFRFEWWNLALLGIIGGASAGFYWALCLAPRGLSFWRAIRLPAALFAVCWSVELCTMAGWFSR